MLAIPVLGESNDLIQTLLAFPQFFPSPPCVHASLSAYLLACSTWGRLTFPWRWSSDRWGHSPTESLEHTNRANDWLIWVSETGAIDRGTMQHLAAGSMCRDQQTRFILSIRPQFFNYKKGNCKIPCSIMLLCIIVFAPVSSDLHLCCGPHMLSHEPGFRDTCLTGLSRPRCFRRPLQPSPGCWAICCVCGSFWAGCGVPGRWWGGSLRWCERAEVCRSNFLRQGEGRRKMTNILSELIFKFKWKCPVLKFKIYWHKSKDP